MSVLKWLLVVVLVVIALLAWRYYDTSSPPTQTPTPTQTVALEMEILGGFAYINEPEQGRFNIAFLKDTGASGEACFVDQQGHKLIVVSGNVVPAGPRKFDLSGKKVTFPGADTSSQVLQVYRGARPNGLPPSPEQDTDWADLKWVPGVAEVAQPAQSGLQVSKLNPDWRNIVDGHVVVTRGKVQAAHPSDFVLRNTTFEFRAANSAADPSRHFTQALTDRVLWNVDVPGNEVVIKLEDTSGATQIVVQPTSSGRKVRLRLLGEHAQGTPTALTEGMELPHFCAFYDLFTPKPNHDYQIRPYVKQLPPPLPGGGGQPSPGALCPGIWPAP